MNIDISERKGIWEDFHKKKDVRALSGCQIEETLDSLQITDILKQKKGVANVLEIGVGLGYVTAALYDLCFVSALDISQEALNRVKDNCVATYLVDDIEILPESHFDIIICTNLVQHIPPELFRMELFYWIRSLKKDGILAMEFVSCNLADETNKPSHVGEFCRSMDLIKKLVDICGGKVEEKKSVELKIKGSNITGAHIVHIRKK